MRPVLKAFLQNAEKMDNIKPGERIVVTRVERNGKDGMITMVATEVRLGTSRLPAGR